MNSSRPREFRKNPAWPSQSNTKLPFSTKFRAVAGGNDLTWREGLKEISGSWLISNLWPIVHPSTESRVRLAFSP